MLGRIMQSFRSASAEKKLKQELKFNIDVINQVGGSDIFCLSFMTRIMNDRNLNNKLIFGLAREDDIKATHSMASFAGINSMMKARKELTDGHDEEEIKLRLTIAEKTFFLSWLIPSVDIRNILDSQANMDYILKLKDIHITKENIDIINSLPHKQWADERLEIAESSLEKWRSADPYEFTFSVKV